MILVKPTREHMSGYVEAISKGWSPDNVRGAVTARDHLRRIAVAPDAFLGGLDDPEARGGPVTLPDGTQAERLPGFVRWIWDGDYCGSISFRWKPGGAELPPHVLGHIGYAVVPWKQGRGYATRALGLLLTQIGGLGLSHVDLTTDPANLASQKVILANGGYLAERFNKLAAYGGGETLRFRIALEPRPICP